MYSLETDQIESVDKLRNALKTYNSVLLQGATGSGKSVIASHIIKKITDNNKTALFLVPRRELVRQMSMAFEESEIKHGFIAAGQSEHRNKAMIASLDTFRNRLNFFPDYAFMDECHYGQDKLDHVINFLKINNSKIIGLSATPWKLSGQGLGCWFDTMVLGPSIEWLIQNKRLSEYRAFSPHTPDLSGIKISQGDYAKGQLSERMEGDRVLIGNAVNHYIKHGEGRPGITFAVSIKHSQMIAEEYRSKGVKAIHMDGNTPEDERRRIARDFATGHIDNICNCDLLTFGYDIALASGVKGRGIQVVSDNAPSKSLSKQMQKWGRGLRYDGQTHIIFDHGGNVREHGMPCEDRIWTLSSREKKNTEKIISVRKCDRCYFDHKPCAACPNCGYVYPIVSRKIEEIDGELTEVEIAKKKKEDRMQVGKARTLEELKRIQQERQYSPGWVYVQARLKGISV